MCVIQSLCDADDTCDGFVYRVRDGAGVLGRMFVILSRDSSADEATFASRQRKSAGKAPRAVIVYLKKGKNVRWSGQPGKQVPTNVCLPLDQAPFRSSPPLTLSRRCAGAWPGRFGAFAD
jgi:hypothetical protein